MPNEPKEPVGKLPEGDDEHLGSLAKFFRLIEDETEEEESED